MATTTFGEFYNTGTVALTADSTAVVGTGVLWTDIEQGDILEAQGRQATVASVGGGLDYDEITLMLPWAGTTDFGVEYVIRKDAKSRFDPALTQAKLREFLAFLDNSGIIYYFVGSEPDEAVGEDGQYALNTSVSPWQLWLKVSGVWVLQDPPSGAGRPCNFLAIGQSKFTIHSDMASLTTVAANATAWNFSGVDGDVGTTYDSLDASSMTLPQKTVNDLARADPFTQFRLTSVSFAGTMISHLLEGTSGLDWFENIEDNIPDALAAAAGATQFDVLLWGQGPSDAADPSHWINDFNTVIGRLLDAGWIGRETLIYIYGDPSVAVGGPVVGGMNVYYQGAANSVPATRKIVDPSDFDVSMWVDPTGASHMTAAGYSAFGSLAADTIRRGIGRQTNGAMVTTDAGFIGLGAKVAPDSLVTLNANAAVPRVPVNNSLLHLIGANGAEPGITQEAYAAVPRHYTVRINGTLAAPTAILSGDILRAIQAAGYDGANERVAASLRFLATQNFAAGSAYGTQFTLSMVLNGATALTEVLRSNSNGTVTASVGFDSPAINSASYTGTAYAVTGTGGAGFMALATQSGNPGPGAAGIVRLFNDAFNRISWINPTDGFNRAFGGTLTAHRSYDWPDATGTVALQSYVDAAVVGLFDDRGNYDASGNVFPSSGGSGSAGAILKGDIWTISVAGTLGGVAVNIGDQVRALVDTPGSTAANWAISEANIGYVPVPETRTVNGHALSSNVTVTKSDVGLGSVPNTDCTTQANVVFTGLSTAAAAADADTLPVNQGAGNLKQTFAAIKTWIKSWIAIGDIGGLAANIATFLATPSSANFAAAITDEVGSDKIAFQSTGTATPQLQFGGASTGITYSTQTLDWLRTGDLMHVWITLVLSSKGSAVGTATITGVPVNAAVNVQASPQGNNLASSVATQFMATISSGSSTVNLQRFATGAANALTDADFNNNSIVRLTFIFKV